MTTKIKYGTKYLEQMIGGLTFGKLLESYRKSQEISQKDFAKFLGMTPSSLCDLEKGRKLPSSSRAFQIAKKIKDLELTQVEDLDLDNFDVFESSLNFESPKEVRTILLKHFVNGEHDSFFEILSLYMNHVGKSKVALEAGIPERTVYNFINGDHKTSSINIFKVMRFISKQVS